MLKVSTLNVIMPNGITLNVIKLSVIMLNVSTLNVITQNAIMLNVTKLNVVMLNVSTLDVITQNAITLNVIKLNVIMLSVAGPLGERADGKSQFFVTFILFDVFLSQKKDKMRKK
jgi:hypothetical protein